MSKLTPAPTGRRLVHLVVVTNPGGIVVNDADAGRAAAEDLHPLDRTFGPGTPLPADTRPDLLDQFVSNGQAVRVTVRVPIAPKETHV